jgi:hypothetical protein
MCMIMKGMAVVAVALGLSIDIPRISVRAHAAVPSGHAAASQAKRAEFGTERASGEARHIANWAVHSGDHKGLPFIILDKVEAKLFAFDERGKLIRATPVLLGMGKGDRFAPGVLEMDMYDTQPWQRITPAGRFEAEEDLNLSGERVLWVDYDSGIAIHRLTTRWTKQRRQERLASPSPADNRITYGCINVPVAFYDAIVSRHFGRNGGIVYVLPEDRPAKSLFGSYDVRDRIQVTQESSEGRVRAGSRSAQRSGN